MITKQGREVGLLKRKINKALKEAGFNQAKKVGVVTRLHGAFSVNSGDYFMSTNSTDGTQEHIIFPCQYPQKILQVESNWGVAYDIMKDKQFKSPKVNFDILHNYLGGEDYAVVESIELTTEEANELMQKIYESLVDAGFGIHLQIKKGAFTNIIKFII